MYSCFRNLLPFAGIALALLCSCNKDEVIEVEELPEPGQSGLRPVSPQSSPFVNNVYEWTPAPGQFINDFGQDFKDIEEVTPDMAADWAFHRLEDKNFVSLGAFGGYIIVGFDHSIVNTGGYDIGVMGNAFLSANGNSNEPGILYVMKDVNGNGLPDDTWFELKGSDTFAPGTKMDYQVTYYKPAKEGAPVEWTDNYGHSGEIKYLGLFHSQPSYYPIWIEDESYTLSGTCLEAKTFQNLETGNWDNPPFLWGYADNIGEDNIALDGCSNCNRFRISDAIDSEGNPGNLDYIDFVKIQTGVCASAGWLGEVSTEILGVVDLNLYFNLYH